MKFSSEVFMFRGENGEEPIYLSNVFLSHAGTFYVKIKQEHADIGNYDFVLHNIGKDVGPMITGDSLDRLKRNMRTLFDDWFGGTDTVELVFLFQHVSDMYYFRSYDGPVIPHAHMDRVVSLLGNNQRDEYHAAISECEANRKNLPKHVKLGEQIGALGDWNGGAAYTTGFRLQIIDKVTHTSPSDPKGKTVYRDVKNRLDVERLGEAGVELLQWHCGGMFVNNGPTEIPYSVEGAEFFLNTIKQLIVINESLIAFNSPETMKLAIQHGSLAKALEHRQ